MKLALAQIAPKLSRQNEALHVSHVKACEGRCDAVIFPELSLNGYALKDAVFEDAYTQEELKSLPLLSQQCDVVFGCVFKEHHRIYNASVYAHKSGEMTIYKKSTLPNYGLFQEARFFFKGEGIAPFQTQFGKTVMAVCEDLFDASLVASIAKANPDVVLVLSNSPARGFGEELEIQQTWETLLAACALHAKAYVVFVNRVGFEDGLGFWGGSCVVSPEGKKISQAPLFESALLHVTLSKTLSNVQKYYLRHA